MSADAPQQADGSQCPGGPAGGQYARWRSRAAAAVALLGLTACVYTPRTVTVYDRDCRIQTRQMVLDEQQVGAIGHCRNEGCLAALVAFGAVSAVTAVVSGSIVVVGNVVYWFEKRSGCRPVDVDTLPAVAPDAPERVPEAASAPARPAERGERVPPALSAPVPPAR